MAIKFSSQDSPAKKSTAARKDVPLDVVTDNANGSASRQSGRNSGFESRISKAGTQALPVDTPSSRSRSKSKDVEEPALRKGHEVSRGAERKEQHPTHKPKIGRPKTDFDRTEYQKLYMRDKATIKRLGLNCTVAEFRKAKEK